MKKEDYYTNLLDLLTELKFDKLYHFIEPIESLPMASNVISGTVDFHHSLHNTDKEHDVSINKHRESINERIKKDYDRICDFNKMRGMKFDVLNEVEENFKNFPQMRETYLKFILGFFSDYIYTHVNTNINWYKGNPFEIDRNIAEKATMVLLIDHHVRNSLKKLKKYSYSKRSIAEKYIIECQDILYDFVRTLDIYCLLYQIDLFQIQKQEGVFLMLERDIEFIKNSVYNININDLGNQQTLNGDETSDQCKYLTLKNAFSEETEFIPVMNLLVDNGYIHKETYRWIDEEKSNFGTIISLIKILSQKGYYNKLKNNEIIQVSKNTFGLEMSFSTVRDHKIPHNFKVFDFIPASPSYLKKLNK
jgi:hypothetical protein